MNEHVRASELLPWMVNGRIEATEARWLAGHLEHCEACRTELAAQRRIREALTREPTVEFAPQASFNRLWKRIEAEAGDVRPRAPRPASALPNTRPVVTPIRGRVRPWVRATLAAQAAAILVLCGVLWLRPGANAYRTVTDAAPAPSVSGAVIKAIFSDQVRLADVKEILASAGLAVAAGPSEAGVYTLVPRDSSLQSLVPSAAARLRADPRVRFAEVGAQ
jgi:anti-sigma factor RsiW